MTRTPRLYAFTAAALLMSAPAYADHYEFDKQHTHIAFLINHLGFSEMLGQFTDYSGGFEFDEKAPEKSKIDVTIKPTSVKTSSATLDEHLQGDKFFNTEKFPEMHFVSTKIKVTGDHDGEVTGDLTLLGVTKPVTLQVHFNKGDYHPMTGQYIAGFSAHGTLNRSDFGMSAYLPMVGDEVKINISTEGVNQDRKKADAIKH